MPRPDKRDGALPIVGQQVTVRVDLGACARGFGSWSSRRLGRRIRGLLVGRASLSFMAVLLICESVMLSSSMVNCGVTTRSSGRCEKDFEQRSKDAQGTKP